MNVCRCDLLDLMGHRKKDAGGSEVKVASGHFKLQRFMNNTPWENQAFTTHSVI